MPIALAVSICAQVVDPWGRVVVDMGPERVGLETCDIDLSVASAVRQRMPIAEHRAKGRAAIRNWGRGNTTDVT